MVFTGYKIDTNPGLARLACFKQLVPQLLHLPHPTHAKIATCNSSYDLFRSTAWFLFKLFGRLMTSIQIHKGQIDILQEVSQVGGHHMAYWHKPATPYVETSKCALSMSCGLRFLCCCPML